MTKASKRIYIATGILIAFTVAIFIISKSTAVAEWFTRHVYFPLAKFFGPFFAHVDFAVFEVFLFIFAAAILTLLIFTIYYFVHKNTEKANACLSSLLLVITCVITIYTTLASTMYNREPLSLSKNNEMLSQEEVETKVVAYFEDFKTVAETIQKNSDGSTICPYSDKELIEKIQYEYSKLTSDYYLSYTATPKQIASSYLMSAFGISGITYIPTMEPGYNYQQLSIDKCVTIAHEIAHTKGIMREDKANEQAYSILLNSEDNYLRYVGFVCTYLYMARALVLVNSEIKVTIPACVKVDKELISSFWDKKAVFESLGDIINSIYLKANSQNGTASYISYDDAYKKTIIDEHGDEKTVYVVNRFSDVQNMIFALY